MNNSIEIEELSENETTSDRNRYHSLISDDILPKNGMERLAGVAIHMFGSLIPYILPLILHRFFRYRSAYLAQEAAKVMEYDSDELKLYLLKGVVVVTILTVVITLLILSF